MKFIAIFPVVAVAGAPLVFPNPFEFFRATEDCHSIKSEGDCMTESVCVWCQAWAIPSVCLTTEEASKVSKDVFVCRERPPSSVHEGNIDQQEA